MIKFAIFSLLIPSFVCGFWLNRTDTSTGVQYVDPNYWTYTGYVRPALERLDPVLRIWLNGVISDQLAAAHGFTSVVDDKREPRFKLLRRLVRWRVLRWLALLAFLKIVSTLFVVVVIDFASHCGMRANCSILSGLVRRLISPPGVADKRSATLVC